MKLHYTDYHDPYLPIPEAFREVARLWGASPIPITSHGEPSTPDGVLNADRLATRLDNMVGSDYTGLILLDHEVWNDWMWRPPLRRGRSIYQT